MTKVLLYFMLHDSYEHFYTEFIEVYFCTFHKILLTHSHVNIERINSIKAVLI